MREPNMKEDVTTLHIALHQINYRAARHDPSKNIIDTSAQRWELPLRALHVIRLRRLPSVTQG